MQFRRLSFALGITSALAMAGAGVVMAQGTSGGPAKPPAQNSIDPVSGSFEVNGVAIDVRGKDANAARQGGWRLAQRKGWEMLSKRLTGHSSTMSDGALDAMVTGIVVENEQIGPTRYIAKLGVLFDRAKAGAILGVSVQVLRSPPMLLVPVEWSGGTAHVFERDTAWQRAWERFHSGAGTIDYVKPQGTGPDALLLNAGQTGRRGRGWWRNVLDRYGARDVLTAEVRLRRDYPGGPVTAFFLASHGPDRLKITQFALRVDSGDGLDAMLDQGIQRIDQAYQDALSSGVLKTDALLAYRPPEAKTETPTDEATPTSTPTPEATETTASFTVQVETPSAAALTASESAVRGVPGVRSATTTSLALGGISVMRVSYDGPIGSLRAALEGRGWSVQEGTGVLRIRRPAPQPNPSPTAKPDGAKNDGG
jgi:hypothetical protein